MYQTRVLPSRRFNRGGWKQELFDPRRRIIFVLAIGIVCVVTTVLVLAFHSTMQLDAISTTTIKSQTEAIIRKPVPNVIPLKPPTHAVKITQEVPITDERNRLIALSQEKDAKRRYTIASTFKSLWGFYSDLCFSATAQKSSKPECEDWFGQNLVRVDALDALWLFELRNEFSAVQAWVERELHFDVPMQASLAETSSRVLGGLLAAFDLSNRPIFLEKAKKLADRLLPLLEHSAIGLPLPLIHLQSGSAKNYQGLEQQLLLGDIGAFQLEFAFISHHTNEPIYAQRALQALRILQKHPLKDTPGLYTTHVDGITANPASLVVTLNPPANTFFSNLFKLHMMFTRRVRWISDMWSEVAKTILEQLTLVSGSYFIPKTLDFGTKSSKSATATLNAGQEGQKDTYYSVSASACSTAGVFAVYSQHVEDSKLAKDVFSFGEGFEALCVDMQQKSASEIASESISVNAALDFHMEPVKVEELRAEIAESVFYMYRVTEDPKYREQAWNIFEAISGRFGLDNLKTDSAPSGKDSSGPKKLPINAKAMRRLIHVFKVLLLTFTEDADLLSIKRHILNADGHPFAIFKPDAALYT